MNIKLVKMTKANNKNKKNAIKIKPEDFLRKS